MDVKLRVFFNIFLFGIIVSLVCWLGYFSLARYQSRKEIIAGLNSIRMALSAEEMVSHIKSICASAPFIEGYHFFEREEDIGDAIGKNAVFKNYVVFPLKRQDVVLVITFASFLELFFTPESVLAFLFIILIVLSLSLATYGFISWYILNPIEEISRTSHDILDGLPPHGVTFFSRNDSVGKLGQTFNQLLLALEQKKPVPPRKTKDTEHQSLSLTERLTATGRLAAGIAHEINNPLGGMINAARTLSRRDIDDDKRAEYLSIIIDGLARIQETIRKIRHFQFSNNMIQAKPVDLPEVIDRSIAFIQHRLDEKNIVVVKESLENIPKIMGNFGDLQQAFLNILKNAMEAIDKEGVIQISAIKGTNAVELLIADSGCGMTEKEVSQAFDVFYTTKSSMQGSGLGLSIVYNIIRNHEGTITLSSEKGAGTVVKIMLPFHLELSKVANG
ncbi:HAMP domain-containing histidine kinase [bacterium]|nr:HAMP domain-containing histidine kinase [bacterium]MCP5461581.1 HAMP domain-containing histidine kinase [bacterium]